MKQIVLIGNYPPDGQESMERFAQMLKSGFENAGVKADIWRPIVFFGKWTKNTTTGLGKWLGYLDKWLIFPILLRWRLNQGSDGAGSLRFHVCDHSNAPYLAHLPAGRTGITCHDVLAIRGAMGYEDAHCPASGFGKILQTWILSHLSRTRILASVSRFTLRQLQELAPGRPEATQNWHVIHNAFNNDFRPMDPHEAWSVIDRQGILLADQFILHVGSGMARKNRRMLLDMVHKAGKSWTGSICFAGQAVDEELLALAQSMGLQNRIVSVQKPDHETLVALYSVCNAFVFPSFSEGFGWPIIEAQACGAPVITSNTEPMPEVSGGAALYGNPSQSDTFVEALLALQDEKNRLELIRQGYINSANFESDRVMQSYLAIHELTVPATVY